MGKFTGIADPSSRSLSVTRDPGPQYDKMEPETLQVKPGTQDPKFSSGTPEVGR